MSEKISNVRSYKVKRAIELGYVELGWGLIDYIRHASESYGWENNIFWGPKGGYKSNLMLQVMYQVYQNWEEVLNKIVFTPMDFIRITKDGGRIPLLGWDDISAHLPRTLYMTNRKLWDAIARNWDLYRPKLNAFIGTCPHKNRVASFIIHDLSGEVIVSRKHVYEYDRWAWDLDYKHHDAESGYPVQVEGTPPKKIDRDAVPTPIFKRYWKRRMELSDVAHQELLELFEELAQDNKNELEVPKELKHMTTKQIKSWAAKALNIKDDNFSTIPKPTDR